MFLKLRRGKGSGAAEAKICQLTAVVERLSSTLIDSGMVKFIIDSGTTILSTIDSIVDALGAIPTILGVITSALAFKNVGKQSKYASLRIVTFHSCVKNCVGQKR